MDKNPKGSVPGPIRVSLSDDEWPMEYTDHDREIVRAVVTDGEGWFYFVRVHRDDEFGNASFIETSGGGVEDGEEHEAALRRELREELGAEVEIICPIGTVSDYYNLIHRHNINHYYLCRAVSFGEKHLTKDETESFHLRTARLTFDEAAEEYEAARESRIGRLIAARELPVLKRAEEILEYMGSTGGKRVKISKRDYLEELRSRVSGDERVLLESGEGLVINEYNLATMKRLLYTQEVFEGTVDGLSSKGLEKTLEDYLNEYMADQPEGHKWIILCCLFLSQVAGEPMHPRAWTKWRELGGNYYCGAREDQEGSVCRWCVCRHLSEIPSGGENG